MNPNKNDICNWAVSFTETEKKTFKFKLKIHEHFHTFFGVTLNRSKIFKLWKLILKISSRGNQREQERLPLYKIFKESIQSCAALALRDFYLFTPRDIKNYESRGRIH